MIDPVLNRDSAKLRIKMTKLLHSPEHQASSSVFVQNDTNFRYDFASILPFLKKKIINAYILHYNQTTFECI